MIYFYYGEDSFRAKQTVDELKRKFIRKYDPSGHSVERIDEDEFTLERFFNAVKSQGFFTQKKFIIIKNIFNVKGLADIEKFVTDFLSTLKNSTDEHYLVFWHEGIPGKSTLSNYLIETCTRLKCSVNFEKLETPALIRWIQREALKEGASIDRGAAELLINLIGDNTWALHHEVRKIAHAASGRITSELVGSMAAGTVGDTIFPFVSALGQKDATRALTLLQRALEDGCDVQYIMAMVIREFRLIAKMRELSQTIKNTYALAQKLRLPEFVVRKLARASAQYDHSELGRIFERLVDLDIIAKTKPADLPTALTLFVAGVAR